MSTDKAVLVINAIVNKEKMAELPEYLNKVMPIFGKNGGKPIARFKTIEQLMGEDSPEMIAVIEFSDSKIIKNLVNGDDFKALSDLRARVFNKLNMMICAGM